MCEGKNNNVLYKCMFKIKCAITEDGLQKEI